MNRDTDTLELASILSRASLPFAFTAGEISSLKAYIDLLLDWNRNFSLTTYDTLEAVTYGLILPSLAFSGFIPSKSDVVDLGTGPGIPSIPLSVLRPDLSFTLVESSEKPYRFLETAVKEKGLSQVGLLNGRAEEAAHLDEYRGRFDIAVARSFAPLPVVVETAAGYVKPGGLTVVHVSRNDAEAANVSRETSILAGARYRESREIELGIPEMEPVGFAVYVQEMACPPQYPRRWKAMKNKPLWDIKADSD